MPSIGREFGSVFLGDKNVSSMVVSEGWAKVIGLSFFGSMLLLLCNIVVYVQALDELGGCRLGSRVNRKEKPVLS